MGGTADAEIKEPWAIKGSLFLSLFVYVGPQLTVWLCGCACFEMRFKSVIYNYYYNIISITYLFSAFPMHSTSFSLNHQQLNVSLKVNQNFTCGSNSVRVTEVHLDQIIYKNFSQF